MLIFHMICKLLWKSFTFFSHSIRKSRKSVSFGDKKINKSNFNKKQKKLFKTDDIDAGKSLVSKKEHYGTKKSSKYFIVCNDNDAIRLLCINALKVIRQCLLMLVIKNCQKCSKIWRKIRNLIGKKSGSEHVYGKNKAIWR